MDGRDPSKHHGFPVGPGWTMSLDDEDNVVCSQERRSNRELPRMSRTLSAIVVAMWAGAITLVGWTVVVVVPLVPKALAWIEGRLSILGL